MRRTDNIKVPIGTLIAKPENHRGIWRSKALRGGRNVVFAVTSTGEEVASVTFHPGIDSVRAKVILTELLDMADPILADPRTHLSVVRGGRCS